MRRVVLLSLAMLLLAACVNDVPVQLGFGFGGKGQIQAPTRISATSGPGFARLAFIHNPAAASYRIYYSRDLSDGDFEVEEFTYSSPPCLNVFAAYPGTYATSLACVVDVVISPGPWQFSLTSLDENGAEGVPSNFLNLNVVPPPGPNGVPPLAVTDQLKLETPPNAVEFGASATMEGSPFATFPDIVVGDPGAGGVHAYYSEGAVFGPDATLDWSSPYLPGDFGRSVTVASVADPAGGGVSLDDVIVGAPLEAVGIGNFGPMGVPAGGLHLLAAQVGSDPAPTGAHYLGSSGDEAAAALAVVGDLGDGLMSVLMGAPGSGNGSGVIQVMQWDAQTGDARLISTYATFTGLLDADDRLGSSLAALRMGAAPGKAHAIVGAPGSDNGVGSAFVMCDVGLVAPADLFQLRPGRPDAGDFGRSVAIGDVTRDGVIDVLVGAPLSSSPGGAPMSGAAYLYVGSSSECSFQLDPDYPIFGSANAQLGTSVALSDVDGDGFDDVILGAPGEGAVYVFSRGSTSGGIQFLHDTAGNDFGRVIASRSDLDGSTTGEIVVGSPATNEVFVLHGPPIAGPGVLSFVDIIGDDNHPVVVSEILVGENGFGLECTLNWGDGTESVLEPCTTVTLNSLTHTYTDDGVYTVRLEAQIPDYEVGGLPLDMTFLMRACIGGEFFGECEFPQRFVPNDPSQ